MKRYPSNTENFDELGCVISYNEFAQEYNRQLKEKVSDLRTTLQDSLIVYVDMYSAKHTLIIDAKQNGTAIFISQLNVLT